MTNNRSKWRRRELTKAILDHGGDLPIAGFILGHSVTVRLDDRIEIIKAKIVWDGGGSINDVLTTLGLTETKTAKEAEEPTT